VCKGRIGNKFRNTLSRKGILISNQQAFERFKNSIKGLLEDTDVVIQERLDNNKEVISCCGFAIDGKVYRKFQYVKLRQHPNEFGTGTFLKSIKNDEIFELSKVLIKHFNYTGIYEIEYIRDAEGKYFVIELNPRTWKSIDFATRCGQNLCAIHYDFMKNQIVPKVNYEYALDRTWADLGTDIPIIFRNRLWGNIGYTRDTFHCVLDHRDPLPFIMEVLLAPLIFFDL
jgi:predicted ATP-grasp superfamily ATP-dependent carboligase